LEFKPALDDGPWTPAAADFPGTGAVITVDIDHGVTGAGFYRLRVLP
jgi:hypothetical protein